MDTKRSRTVVLAAMNQQADMQKVDRLYLAHHNSLVLHMPTGSRLRVVIVGGGFGGLSVAKSLKSSRVEITLIDRTNHHLFQPLLYQVATAALSPGDIAQPLRAILRGRDNVRVVMDNVTGINQTTSQVVGELASYAYDVLVLAPGSRHAYFGHSEWEAYAPGLKTVNDALAIRSSLLVAFEKAERTQSTEERRELLTFVVVGGGPTGVELAGAIAEISQHTMLPDFPRLHRSDVRVLLVEAADRLLSAFDPRLSAKALSSLRALGVEVHLRTRVVEVTQGAVTFESAERTSLHTSHVIWAAGNAASPILASLDSALDSSGRVVVDQYCRVPGHSNVFVIGDCAHFEDASGHPLPGVAQTATQMGVYVAKGIHRIAQGKEAFAKGFEYKDLGSMATIGRARAVADVFGLKFGGFVAWLAWAGLHILKLISFRNRLKVLVEWMWYYVSFQPGARLLYHNRQDRNPDRLTTLPNEHG